MSYLPYVLDFDRHERMPTPYSMSFIPETLFDSIDASVFEYFPKLSKFNNTRKPSKDRFEVYLDVEDYGPEDIKVKTVDGFVIVEGQHKEKKDEYGWVQRQFYRRCPIPAGYKTKALLSQYSSDGTLAITANLVKSDEGKCDIIEVKKLDENEEKADQPKLEEPSPESDEDESEKKPVKSKSDKEKTVEIKVDFEKNLSIFSDEDLKEFLIDFDPDDKDDD